MLQGELVTCLCVFQTSLKPVGELNPNFMWSLSVKGGGPVYINGPGKMTKMGVMPLG